MALPRQFSLLHSQFNEFLFASVGEESNGAALTVLSALTRLDIDPWAEAARLIALPQKTAEREMAATIALLPKGNLNASDLSAIAAHLVDLLRRHGTPTVTPLRGENGRNENQKAKRGRIFWLTCIILILLAVSLLAAAHFGAEPASRPHLDVNSSTQP